MSAGTSQNGRGARIRLVRTNHGWTQEQLGEKLGVSARTVSAWEAGATIARPNALALARLVGTTEEWIHAGTLAPQAMPAPDDALEKRLDWLETRAAQHDTIVRYGFQAVAAKVEALAERVEELTAAVESLVRVEAER